MVASQTTREANAFSARGRFVVRAEGIAGVAQSVEASGHKAGQRNLEVKAASIAHGCNYDNAAGSAIQRLVDCS